METEYHWERQYEAAVLETDRTLLEKRVEEAKLAIQARVQELRTDHQGTEERAAIESALFGLNILQREVKKGVSIGCLETPVRAPGEQRP